MLVLSRSMATATAEVEAATAAAVSLTAQSRVRLDTEVGSDEVEDMDTSEPDWAWFYLAECGQWHMFGSDPFAAITVNSSSIEQSYMRNRHGGLEFHTHKYSYRIDFKDMKQTNLDTGKQRPVKRAVQTVATFRSICDTPAVPVPSHWEAVNVTEPYQLVALMQESLEFRQVKELYERTMSNTIRSIHRIQNSDLWEFFCRKREQLRRIKKGAEVQERMLFHGTSVCNIPAICMFNFDWRLTGSHGSVYGKGSYFARDAKYSSKYCDVSPKHLQSLQVHGFTPTTLMQSPYKCMFLARVLVGEYTLGSSTLCRPPSKDGTPINVYDSCVDDAVHPKIFVVFDSNQVYPEYLIEFH